MWKRYKKKPIIIEAFQMTSKLNSELVQSAVSKDEFYITHNDVQFMVRIESNRTLSLAIKTLEGEHKVSINDYIIKGIKNEFYPCKPDIFKATYEEVI